jgi:hypothetical protein
MLDSGRLSIVILYIWNGHIVSRIIWKGHRAMLEGQIENLINPFNRAYLQLAFDVIRNIGKIFDVLVGN